MLTACGIETRTKRSFLLRLSVVATVLTACGIETVQKDVSLDKNSNVVATVLTACGIET